MSDENEQVDGQASEEPAFLADDDPYAEIPFFITTTNAREVYGLREGETVSEAIARSHDAIKFDPSRAVGVDQVRERLASEQVKSQGWLADDVKEFASVWDAIESMPEAAAEMKLRSAIMMALKEHLTGAGITETHAARMLGVAASRVSDLMNDKFSLFALDDLVRMSVAAGLKPSAMKC